MISVAESEGKIAATVIEKSRLIDKGNER